MFSLCKCQLQREIQRYPILTILEPPNPLPLYRQRHFAFQETEVAATDLLSIIWRSLQ